MLFSLKFSNLVAKVLYQFLIYVFPGFNGNTQIYKIISTTIKLSITTIMVIVVTYLLFLKYEKVFEDPNISFAKRGILFGSCDKALMYYIRIWSFIQKSTKWCKNGIFRFSCNCIAAKTLTKRIETILNISALADMASLIWR